MPEYHFNADQGALSQAIFQRGRIAVGAAVLACALLSATDQALATPGVIVAPKPGQDVTRHPVRFVVRSGPESADLRARLNGVPIGSHFLVGKPGQRVLSASASHGLQHGPNVLEVSARRGSRVRHATVRFNVAHQRPLTGAGRDRTAVVGNTIELGGRVTEHPEGPSGDEVRWEVVAAPRGSEVQTGDLPRARSLTPGFRPDVHGSYRFRLTASSGAAASAAGAGSIVTSDETSVNVVPQNPLVPVATALAGSTEDPRPRIQVGEAIFRANPLCRTGNCKGSVYLGAVGAHGYRSYWQVLVLDRATLSMKSNRTYGICSPLGKPDNDPASFFCRTGSNGEPIEVDPEKELAAAGPGALVIASTHQPTPGAGDDWGQPNVLGFTFEFNAIGFPASTSPDLAPTQLDGVSAGGVSVIGVPGMKGEADYTINADGFGLKGYLTPDQNTPSHYGFIPGTRGEFDTRSETQCDAQNGCTVSQTVGEKTVTASLPAGDAGFLVSAFDRITLAFQDSKVIATGTSGRNPGASSDGVAGMANYVRQWDYAGSHLVVITSVHAPDVRVAESTITREQWAALAQAVAEFGGTLHGFNSAAANGSDYTLVGWGGAGPGGGAEAFGSSARMRGALVQNNRSLFEPANTSLGEAPPERLAQLVMRTPSGSWPLDGDTGASNAIAYIGSQVSELGSDPRSAYWTQVVDASFRSDVEDVEMPDESDIPPAAPFKSADFDRAKAQLKKELGYVIKVYKYMDLLAYPGADAGANAWAQSQTLADKLAQQIQLDKNASVAYNPLPLIEGLLDLVGSLLLGPEFKAVTAFIATAAAVTEVAASITSDSDGSPSSRLSQKIVADDFGITLRNQAVRTSQSFEAMGDIIVSDWSKLQEVGRYGACNPNGGCPPGYEEYAYSKDMQQIAVQTTELALERTVHEQLLPVTYPIWDTRLSKPSAGPPATDLFRCTDMAPFRNAPTNAYFSALDSWDPNAGQNLWRTYLAAVALPDGASLSHPPAAVLNHMFGAPVSGGLGIVPADFFQTARRETPEGADLDCAWLAVAE